MLGGGSRRSEGKKEEAREGTHAAPSREASSGTALTTAMEKQEGLLEQVLSRSGAPGEAEARNELAALHGVLAGLSQKTVIDLGVTPPFYNYSLYFFGSVFA